VAWGRRRSPVTFPSRLDREFRLSPQAARPALLQFNAVALASNRAETLIPTGNSGSRRSSGLSGLRSIDLAPLVGTGRNGRAGFHFLGLNVISLPCGPCRTRNLANSKTRTLKCQNACMRLRRFHVACWQRRPHSPSTGMGVSNGLFGSFCNETLKPRLCRR
jgi:hypothetical protein